ncbi:MAG: RNase adapter RapZ [bacterium]|nr:RNase adapter RapZ [bacterium]
MTKPNLRMVILSGLSGSGKTSAMHELEDLGFYCVDNLPIAFLPKFVEMLSLSRAEITKVALVIDIRARESLPDFPEMYRALKAEVIPELLFLECEDTVLARRFSETRRRHPLAEGADLLAGVAREREELRPIRELADKIWDTTLYSIPQFRRAVRDYFAASTAGEPFAVKLLSFGYKAGIPFNADLVLDVRFLPNPFFVEELRTLNGTDPRVQEYIFSRPEGAEFVRLVRDFLNFLLPCYQKEGRPFCTIAFGCTGGQHRSVAVAERVGNLLREGGYRVNVSHRDSG